MGARSRALIERRYTLTVQAETHLSLYQKLDALEKSTGDDGDTVIPENRPVFAPPQPSTERHLQGLMERYLADANP